MPKISVLMPVYNGEKFLKKSIQSVLKQNFNDFEFLILDDGSTDESLLIIKKYARIDKRIRVIKNKKNLGIQRTLNKGIRLSEGEYIARIDSDDLWCNENKLKEQIFFLEKNSEYGLIGTAMILIDEEGKELSRVNYPQTDNAIREKILMASQFAHPSVLIRRKALDQVGFYSEDKKYKHIEDYELWLRLGSKYKLANLKGYYLKYRISPKGLSFKNQFKQRKSGLKLTFDYANQYPRAFKAFLIKAFTLPLSRSNLDLLFKKSSFIRNSYQRITGIKKS